jgi:hypothetical protein
MLLANLEDRFVGHRDTTFLEILDQIIDAIGNALAFGVQRGLDEFRIGCSKIGGRHRIGRPDAPGKRMRLLALFRPRPALARPVV